MKTLKMDDDLYFNIGSKIRLEAGIRPSTIQVYNVFDLLKSGILLENISFIMFDWCGYQKLITKIKQ